MTSRTGLDTYNGLVRLAWRDLRHSGRHLWVFWTCCMLGVTLIAGSGGLLRQISEGLLADSRALFGGDLEVRARAPLDEAPLDWIRARGEVSRLVELRTMMLARGRPQLVELQVVDDAYPLYGTVELDPAIPLSQAVTATDVGWGAAIDPVLARRLELRVGDRITVGTLALEVRALIRRQPDRSLSADWRGAPVIIAEGALAASGLIAPGSRLEYHYRVRVADDPGGWSESLSRLFPDAEFEVRTFDRRRDRMAEVLGKVASGLLLIGFSALLVGGLGVFNSVRAYLDTRLATIATLRALGLRDGRVATVYLLQVLVLAASAALAGAALGGALAVAGGVAAAARLPVAQQPSVLLPALAGAFCIGVLTAFTFALPAVGRALAVSPAALFRGIDPSAVVTPTRWWRRTVACAAVLAAAVLAFLPEPGFGAAFLVGAAALMLLLEGLVRAVRAAARRLGESAVLGGGFALRLAVSSLHRPGAPLRVTLLTLGSAVTVLVASTLVVAALLDTIARTVPDRAPALVLYDVSTDQVASLRAILDSARTLEAAPLTPLVLGRLSHVNGEALAASKERARTLEARDEHKLTHRFGNIDEVDVTRGRWWPPDYAGPPLVAFEDREADQLGLQVGDRLRFRIMDQEIEAQLAAIYSQRGIGTRFWFEGIFSDGTLKPFVTRYVGTAYLDHAEAVDIETRIARAMPNVVIVRTERILNEARAMLARAATGLAVIAALTLLSSQLVLTSVVAASRARHLYDASVLVTLGARIGAVRTSLSLEYALVAVLTSVVAITFGGAIAAALLSVRIGIEPYGLWWLGTVVAVTVSTASLALGARSLLRSLRLSPAVLLRAGG